MATAPIQDKTFCGQWYHSDNQLGTYGRFLFQNLSKDAVPNSSWDTMEAFWRASGTQYSLPANITFFVFKGQVFHSELSDWFAGKDFFGMGPFIGSVLFRSEFGQQMSPTMEVFWQSLDKVCCDVGNVVSFFIVERCKKQGASTAKKKSFENGDSCCIL